MSPFGGLDVAVNGTWLAMKWALESADAAAIKALEDLILDWPFDFHLFDGVRGGSVGGDHE